MSDLSALGFGSPRRSRPEGQASEQVLRQHPLRRILAFTRHSIDDVINDPIARNQVIGYYKLHRWIERESEISELERQWNSV